MPLYDILNEMAEQQVTKTDTGDNRIFGVMTGVVAKNYDESMPGRVCVTIPVRDDKANELQWARVSMPSSGSNWGHYFLPEIGDMVLLAFEQGNIEKPYVIGCIPKDSDKFHKKSVDQDNQIKRIMTKNGSYIAFEDNKEGEGDKDKITIHTAKDAHQILLDNENKVISIQDKDKKNRITIQTEDGKMLVNAEKKLEIKVGDVSITINGESGAVNIKCAKLSVKADSSAHIETDGSAALNGANVKVEATSNLALSSSGVASLTGTPTKLG